MSPLVLDASIVVGWLLSDEDDARSEYVSAWLRQEEGIVPQHWHYEIRNALLSAERRGRTTASETAERLDSLSELPIRTDRQADLQEALRLARMYRLSFYDALYLELAKRSISILATLDTELAEAAISEGLEVPIV